MPALISEVVKLTGEITAWNVRAADGWGTGTIETADGSIDFTGKLIGARAGDTVEIEGTWQDHEKYGRRLNVRACTVARAETESGVVAWLTSALPDVGAGRARELTQRFPGEQLWSVIEATPGEGQSDPLCSVNGITPRRAARIREAYVQHRAQRDDMITLRGWGLTDGQIARCVEQWKNVGAVVKHIRENPYELSQAVYGFGFLRADVVAMKSGLKYDSPQRVAAAVEHVLDEATTDGHCYLPAAALQLKTIKLLGVPEALVVDAVNSAIRAGRVVMHGDRIYARKMDTAERVLADALARLLRRRTA